MFTFFMVIHIFVCMVLIFVILMQAGRGGGVSEIFGGSSTQTIFGTSVTRFLTKATGVCAALFIITSLSLAVLSSRRSRSLMESEGVLPVEVEEKKDVAQEGAVPSEGEKETVEPKDAPTVSFGGEESKDVSQENVMPAED